MKRSNVVVVSAKRAPMGKSGWKAGTKKGIHYWASPQDFAGQILENIWKDTLSKIKDKDAISPKDIEAVAYGCSGQYGAQSGDIGRIACIMQDRDKDESEFFDVFGITVDSYCNAGSSAIQYINNMLALGQGEIGVAGGQELLSIYPLGSSIQATTKDGHKHQVLIEKMFMKRTLGLGPAGEKIAGMWDLKRDDLDKFAARSHYNMIRIQRQKDKYEPRIMPITHMKRDEDGKKVRDENRKVQYVTHKVDETPRDVYFDNPEKAMTFMKKLKPRFKTGGVIHAGNSSAISDGGAALMLMTEEKAEQLGIKPLVRIIDVSNSASDPRIVLTGPIPASRKIFERNDIKLDDLDLIHINEAFASVPFVTMQELGGNALEDERLNTSGGAIAGGHPIGASGAAWAVELIWEMIHSHKRLGLFTLCAGFGNGQAILFENMQM
jgi:acetyl-CoA acetyltransferase family protein